MYRKAALVAHPVYRLNITRLQQACVTVLEGERSVTVRDDGLSWTAAPEALAAVRERHPNH
jgi:hypothetical protein